MFGSQKVWGKENGEEKYEERKNCGKFINFFSCLIVYEKNWGKEN